MLKQILSTKPGATALNIALLILRVGMAILMVPHGYQKLTHFGEYKAKFMDFMGLGAELSLALTVGAELVCALLLAAGLLTRVVVLPLVFAMVVAVFKAHNGEVFGDGEMGTLYLVGYLTILIAGGGKYSFDGLVLKR